MKNKIVLAIFGAFSLVACGPGPESSPQENGSERTAHALETTPQYDSAGVISAVDGSILTLDHDGASVANLPPGRNDFVAFADVLSEAPLEPGSRVAFKFRRNDEGLELTELKAR